LTTLTARAAWLNRVRQQVIELLHGKEPESAHAGPRGRGMLSRVEIRLDAVEARLAYCASLGMSPERRS
jgi:hypothetical protein